MLETKGWKTIHKAHINQKKNAEAILMSNKM